MRKGRAWATVVWLGWASWLHAEGFLQIQDSPLAGSQFHALKIVSEVIQAGDVLELIREPQNPHDTNAIQVCWKGVLLGYVPRRENRALAAALDEGEIFEARVVRVTSDRNPWLRLRFSVWAKL